MAGIDEAWTAGLSLAVARTLDEFRYRLADRVELLVVDCHPWDGTLDLSLLTSSEVMRDPLLAAASEMAAWKFFHFAGGLASWRPALELGRRMRDRYAQSGGGRASVAEGYLRACAVALVTGAVRESMAKYDLADDFRLSVPHPDTDRNFYPPA